MKLSNFKKLAFAAAFAVTASTGAVAQVDLDDAAEVGVLFADEAKGTVDGNGRYRIAANAVLNVTGSALVGTPVSGSRHIRFALTNAVFAGVPTLSQIARKADGSAGTAITSAAGTAAITGGGAAQDSFVSFQLTTGADQQILSAGANSLFVLTVVTGLDISPAGAATITYSVHDTLGDAISGDNPVLSSTAPYVTIQAGYANAMAACSHVATVASGFTTLAGTDAAGTCPAEGGGAGGAGGDVVVIGSYTLATTSAAAIAADYRAADGNVVANADIITAAQVVTITGDVSNGVFSANTANDCAAGTTIAMTKNADNTAASTADTGPTNANMWFCLDASALAEGETIKKGSYTVQAMTDQSAAVAIGSITYDTTTVEAPYITTYEGYNQRIFIDNRGATAAYYSTFLRPSTLLLEILL